MAFGDSTLPDRQQRSLDWDLLDAGKFEGEAEVIERLLADPPLDHSAREEVAAEAAALVDRVRRSRKKQGLVENFLKEFSLGTREGLALMCLAEALLRTPDAETRDRLIAEKVGWLIGLIISGIQIACSSTPPRSA